MGSKFHQHPKAIVDDAEIGDGTRVWAFAHVMSGARVGAECNVGECVYVEGGAVVGDRVTIKNGVQVWDAVELGDDVFVGPNATFTNDPFPRSRVPVPEYPRTRVGNGASIGANATILPGITIGAGAMVGAGAVVTSDVPPHAVVVGNPARIVRYVDAGTPLDAVATRARRPEDVRVRGVRLIEAPLVRDMRGNLVARQVTGGTLPFVPQRFFMVLDVPTARVRGEHAHRECHQLLTCAVGSIALVVDDGENRQEILLDSPQVGVYVPPMIWGIQYKYSRDAILLVAASHDYDPDDYIRDYDQFLAERAKLDGRAS